jgi:Flp pilus assembly protein TadD
LTIRKSFVEAETILRKSVAVSPNSFVSYALLGSLYSRRGQLVKAEQTLRKALKVISKKERKRLAQEFEEVGDGFLSARRKADAARVFRQAQILDPDNKSVSLKLIKTRK